MRMIKTLTISLFITGAALVSAPIQARDTPYSNFNFIIVMDGVRLGGFTEVSGLATENDVVEYRDGSGDVEIIRKTPDVAKYPNVTLKRGIISGDTDLWDWRQQVIDDDMAAARRDGSIIMYDKDMQPFAVWNFENAWPVKVAGPVKKSDGNDIAIEELTLAVEYIRRSQ